VRVAHEQCGHQVHVEVRCPHCERAVAPAELRAEPGAPLPRRPREGEPGNVSARRLYGAEGGVRLTG
jgi:hypothetical protein